MVSKWIRSVSVKTRLIVMAAAGVLAVAVCTADGLWSMSRLTTLGQQVFVSKDVVADILPPPLYLIEMRLVISQRFEGSITPAEARQQIERLTREYEGRVAHWKDNPPNGLERELLGAQHEAGLRLIAAAQTLANRSDSEETAALREFHALYVEHRAGVDKTVAAANRFAEDSNAAFSNTVANSRVLMVSVLAVAVFFMLLLATITVRSIVVPLQRATETIRRIAAGDLTVGVNTDGRDEIATLSGALLHMRDQLRLLVTGIRQNSEHLVQASSEISAGNNDLAQRTETQAAALQEIAATMAELTQIVRGTAEHAQAGSQHAEQANRLAQKGGQSVRQFVDTMNGITSSSKQMADIIGFIDGIAFQINILALNAAVEAARAGEQGRGFAVVASEVRSLAGRSAKAAREIRDLIQDGVTRANRGAGDVQAAGRTMDDVVEAIQRVSVAAHEISVASSEQSQGVNQVAQAVVQIEQGTQQNAALVEQTAAAAESLVRQADAMQAAVASFRLQAA